MFGLLFARLTHPVRLPCCKSLLWHVVRLYLVLLVIDFPRPPVVRECACKVLAQLCRVQRRRFIAVQCIQFTDNCCTDPLPLNGMFFVLPYVPPQRSFSYRSNRVMPLRLQSENFTCGISGNWIPRGSSFSMCTSSSLEEWSLISTLLSPFLIRPVSIQLILWPC